MNVSLTRWTYLGLFAAALLTACAAPASTEVALVPTAAPTPMPTTAPPPTSPPTPAPAFITGRVWQDMCAAPDGVEPAPASPPPGCVAARSARGYKANGLLEAGEPGIGGVLIRLGAGPCPSTGLATATTGADGSYGFNGLSAGTYCVSVDPADSRHASILLPGDWTYPVLGSGIRVASIAVAVAAGENKPEVSFGWEYRPLATPVPSTPPPVAATSCADKATFVRDVTIPDNTNIAAGASFVKTWRIRNSGTCEWTTAYALTFVSGRIMGGPISTPLPHSVSPGSTIDLILTLIAPTGDGVYQGRWKLRSASGLLFGSGAKGQNPFWVQIVVGSAPVPTAAPGATATPAPAATPLPHPSGPTVFELGGQVSDFTAPDKMKYAGMAWVKRQIRWTPGAIASAELINDAHARGFKILLSVVGTSPDVISGGSNYDAYVAYVGELARQGADGIEVWNEMNIDREWPTGQINPVAYTDLLRRAYSQIKSQNPGTLVIAGAPAPTGAEGAFGLNRVWNDDHYIGGMAAAGAASYMDCVGVHYNEGILSPTQSTGDPRGNYYTRYYAGMVNTYFNAFGGAKKLCFTELGYLTPEGYGALPPAFAWAGNTSVAQQAQWLSEVANLARNSGLVRLLIIFNVDFTKYGDDPQAGYAIIRPGGACPACDSLHALTGGR